MMGSDRRRAWLKLPGGGALCFSVVLASAAAAAAQAGEAIPLGHRTKTHATERGPAVTFTGFEEFEDGSSRIYVKLTSAVPVEPHVAGKKAEYVFSGAHIPVKNNKNPLITEHFLTSVLSARWVSETEGKGRHKERGMRLVVLLRDAVTPAARTDQNPDGTATWIVDFPKPEKPPTPPPSPLPPKSAPINP